MSQNLILFGIIAVVAICLMVSKFLKVEVPKVEPKPKAKKISKAEKRRLAAAARADEGPDPVEVAKAAKAAKRREKERAKKEAKKAAEEEAKAAKAAAEAEAAEAEAAKTAAVKKNKKKKKKPKKGAAATEAAVSAPVVEEIVEAAAQAEPAHDNKDWEEVKVKKGKMKKVEDPTLEDAPAFTLDMYVEKKHFGLIIGERGSTLQAIQEATGTEIDLPKDGGIRREIIISGEVEGCKQAQAAIKQLIAKGYSEITHAQYIDTEIEVPPSKRALLIGKGGENIKAIQEKTGCRVNLPEKGGDSDIVSVVGDSDNVKAALQAIKQLIDQGYSDLTHENFMKEDIEVARDMLRLLIGPGGATIRSIQESTKTRINVPNDKSGDVLFVSILGEAADVAGAKAQIAALLIPPEPIAISDEWQKEASLVHMVW